MISLTKLLPAVYTMIFLRKNSNREDKSPLDTLKETGEDIDPDVLTLPALDLDKLLSWKLNKANQGGHDVPGLAWLFRNST